MNKYTINITSNNISKKKKATYMVVCSHYLDFEALGSCSVLHMDSWS